MAYMVATKSPIATDYFRSLGFSKVHFGILGGAPMVMMGMQFVGALWANRLRSRRITFMVLLIAGRLIWVSVVMLPHLVPGLGSDARAAAIIGLFIVMHALLNLGPPIWMSWMGDIIPKRVISRYWGRRMQWMQVVRLISNGALIPFSFYYEKLGFTLAGAFTLLVAIGVTAGVIDIVLFAWVDEPPAAPVRSRPVLSTIFEPLRHADFRRYLTWYCCFSAALHFGGAFMQLYVLDCLGVPLWIAVFIWWTFGIGSAASSGFWGRMIDRHGSRPVMIVCTVLKPMSPLVFMLMTRGLAPIVLPVFFLLDSCLNSGWMLATNGFMLRVAPRENRGMFTAAMASLPSFCAGLAAIAAGFLLRAWEGTAVEFAGKTWTSFHFLFLLCAILRASCIPLALRVREPRSDGPRHVLAAIAGILPLRLRSLPVTADDPDGSDRNEGQDGARNA